MKAVWQVLGNEPDGDRVAPLLRGPRVHIIGKAPAAKVAESSDVDRGRGSG